MKCGYFGSLDNLKNVIIYFCLLHFHILRKQLFFNVVFNLARSHIPFSENSLCHFYNAYIYVRDALFYASFNSSGKSV